MPEPFTKKDLDFWTFADFGGFPDRLTHEESFPPFTSAGLRRSMAQAWWEEQLQGACADRATPGWPDDFAPKLEWLRLCQGMVQFLAETRAGEPGLFNCSASSPKVLSDFQRGLLLENSNTRAEIEYRDPAEQQRISNLALTTEKAREFRTVMSSLLQNKLEELDRFNGYQDVDFSTSCRPDRTGFSPDKFSVITRSLSMHGFDPWVVARIAATEENLALSKKIAREIYDDCCLFARDIYGDELSVLRLDVGTRALITKWSDRLQEPYYDSFEPAAMVNVDSGTMTVYEFGSSEKPRKEKFVNADFASVLDLRVRLLGRRTGEPLFSLTI